jgi:SAM-dependent methyltransferase
MAAVRILSRPPENPFPQEWYGMATADHFWMEWRLRVFLRLLGGLGVRLDAPLHGIEIGCGVGTLRRQLEQRGAWTLDGADIDQTALESNPELRGETLLYDVHDRREEVAGAYDFVILFDVLEHIAEPVGFVRDCLFLVKPGGWIFVNVPALESMRSKYDEVTGHLRRYDTALLETELRAGGAEPRESRYWGFTMLPLLAVRRLTLASVPRDEIVRRGFVPPGRFVNAALRTIGHLETAVISRPPAGTSVLAAAVKAR